MKCTKFHFVGSTLTKWPVFIYQFPGISDLKQF
jgi:hypothetical protein